MAKIKTCMCLELLGIRTRNIGYSFVGKNSSDISIFLRADVTYLHALGVISRSRKRPQTRRIFTVTVLQGFQCNKGRPAIRQSIYKVTFCLVLKGRVGPKHAAVTDTTKNRSQRQKHHAMPVHASASPRQLMHGGTTHQEFSFKGL